MISVARYPNKPIRFIAPGPAGGPGDMAARLIGQKLTESWGQPLVIENHVNNVGLGIAAEAVPDGYTIAMAGGSSYISPSIYRKLPFDPVKDFVPISLVASVFNILVVHPSIPAQSLTELITYAKSNPGRLKYGSSGHGSAPHIAGELFKKMAGVDIAHVPYRGHLAAGTAVSEGRDVQLMFDAMPTALPHVRTGKLRAIAVTTAKRVSTIPEIPTISECGLSGYEVNPAMGVLAPIGTPQEIILHVSKEIARIMQMPDVIARFQSDGAEPIGSTPEQFAVYIKSALEKWARVVRDAGVEILESPT